ncbi:MAG TPA: hypothetical protein VFP39_00480 [Gemmatimonadales bacterium]|nr:hypothetical protein [Gemmatimonadales bacterium]
MPDHIPKPIARRDALRRLGILTAGLASACTPLRIVLHDYPSAFDAGSDAVERALRAFVLTVIPEADASDPNLTRAFGDPDLRFAAYRGFFVSDLCQRAAARTGTTFDHLSQSERLAVVQEGLAADATTQRLYSGAILVTQASYYGGIYDDQHGCALIDFEGAYQFRGIAAITYPDPQRFLSWPLTADGNWA